MSDSNNKIFQPDLESVSEFLERFKLQNHTILEEKKEDNKSRAMLLANALPVDILTDIQRKLKPKKLSETTYEEIENHLTSLHSTKKSIIGAAVAFLHRRQQNGESIENFAKSLNELASQCNYSDCCRDRMLRDAFVSGLNNTKIMSSLIHEAESKKFNELVEKAKLFEQLQIDIADISPAAKQYQQNAVRHEYPKKYNNNKTNGTQSGYSNNRLNNNNKKQDQVSSRQCYRCGQFNTHLPKDCFALKLKCSKCSLMGHLAKMCKTKSSNKSEAKQTSHFNHIAVKEEEEDPAKFGNVMFSVRREAAPSLASPPPPARRLATAGKPSPSTASPPPPAHSTVAADSTRVPAVRGSAKEVARKSNDVYHNTVSCFNKFDSLSGHSDTDTSEEGDTEVTTISSINGIYNNISKADNKSTKKPFLE